jgi:hypothetical protein
MTNTMLDAPTSALARLGEYAGGTADAATDRIYGTEGVRVSRRQRRNEDPTYQRRFGSMMRLYEDVVAGDRYAALRFQEAMSTSDFTNLFGDIIDRQLLAAYQTQPVQWDAIARRGRVRDFRTVKRFTLDGGEATLDAVKELAEYPMRSVADGAYSYKVGKYGDVIAVSWETLVNDDLDAMSQLPQKLGNAARRTEERFAATLFSGSGGPDATFFSTAHKNIINPTVVGSGSITNPPLSISAVQLAMQVLGQQVDSDGGPIYVEGVVLVVPPALKVPAMNIVNAVEILAASGGGDGTGNDQLRVNNWMTGGIRVVVNPWLPIINTTSGNTAWYLFADPSVGRPALEVGFLIGHETPELWVRSPNAMRVGGGPVAPEEGDFEHDAVQYRVRHVLGGVLMDPKSALSSTGLGS